MKTQLIYLSNPVLNVAPFYGIVSIYSNKYIITV